MALELADDDSRKLLAVMTLMNSKTVSEAIDRFLQYHVTILTPRNTISNWRTEILSEKFINEAVNRSLESAGQSELRNTVEKIERENAQRIARILDGVIEILDTHI